MYLHLSGNYAFVRKAPVSLQCLCGVFNQLSNVFGIHVLSFLRLGPMYMYLSKIAPVTLLGLCELFNQLSNTFGILSLLGINTGLAPMYLSEIAPVSLRGLCGVFNQLSITFGVLMSQVIGLKEVLGQERTWQFALGKYYIFGTVN